MIKIIRIKLLLEVERDGEGFHAFCTALKGMHVDGATEAEAVENATAASTAYIDSLLRHGEPLPVGCNVSELGVPLLSRLRSLIPRRHHLITTEVSCAA